MRENNSGGGLSEYLAPAVPKIFTETMAALDRMESKLKRGGDLHSKDIETVRAIFHEENLDAKSLTRLVKKKTSSFSGSREEKIQAGYAAIADISRVSARACKRVSDVFDHTSMNSAFFTMALIYLEEYESRHGKSKEPWLDESVLFQLIGEDFERAKAACVSFNESAGEALVPIQGKIAFFAQQGNAAEVSRFAIERAFLSGALNEGSKPLMDTIRADFEKLRTRAEKHGYKLSFVWD